jgi:hypothetical protein
MQGNAWCGFFECDIFYRWNRRAGKHDLFNANRLIKDSGEKSMNRIEFERVSPGAVGISVAAIEAFINELESGFTEPHGLMILRTEKFAPRWWSPYAPGIRHGLQSLSKT